MPRIIIFLDVWCLKNLKSFKTSSCLPFSFNMNDTFSLIVADIYGYLWTHEWFEQYYNTFKLVVHFTVYGYKKI
jgi:hypothetical protein